MSQTYEEWREQEEKVTALVQELTPALHHMVSSFLYGTPEYEVAFGFKHGGKAVIYKLKLERSDESTT